MDLTLFDQRESRTVPVQSKFSESEAALLDSFVEALRAEGVNATKSSVVRSLVLDGIRRHGGGAI